MNKKKAFLILAILLLLLTSLVASGLTVYQTLQLNDCRDKVNSCEEDYSELQDHHVELLHDEEEAEHLDPPRQVKINDGFFTLPEGWRVISMNLDYEELSAEDQDTYINSDYHGIWPISKELEVKLSYMGDQIVFTQQTPFIPGGFGYTPSPIEFPEIEVLVEPTDDEVGALRYFHEEIYRYELIKLLDQSEYPFESDAMYITAYDGPFGFTFTYAGSDEGLIEADNLFLEMCLDNHSKLCNR